MARGVVASLAMDRNPLLRGLAGHRLRSVLHPWAGDRRRSPWRRRRLGCDRQRLWSWSDRRWHRLAAMASTTAACGLLCAVVLVVRAIAGPRARRLDRGDRGDDGARRLRVLAGRRAVGDNAPAPCARARALARVGL